MAGRSRFFSAVEAAPQKQAAAGKLLPAPPRPLSMVRSSQPAAVAASPHLHEPLLFRASFDCLQTDSTVSVDVPFFLAGSSVVRTLSHDPAAAGFDFASWSQQAR